MSPVGLVDQFATIISRFLTLSFGDQTVSVGNHTIIYRCKTWINFATFFELIKTCLSTVINRYNKINMLVQSAQLPRFFVVSYWSLSLGPCGLPCPAVSAPVLPATRARARRTGRVSGRSQSYCGAQVVSFNMI